MNSIALGGLGLIVLYIALILQKASKQKKDYLLAIVFLIIGFELYFRYLNSSIENLYSSWLVGLDLFYWVLFGPIMYLYIECVIHEDRIFELKDLRHLILLLFLFIPYGSFLVSNVEDKGFFLFIGESNLFYKIIVFIWDHITPAYFIYIVIKLINHKRNAINYFSNLKKKDLGWLLYLSGGYTIFLVIAISLFYLNQLTNQSIPAIDIEVGTVPLILYVFGLGLYGYKQEGIFNEDFLKHTKDYNKSIKKERELKYARTSLTAKQRHEIIKNLEIVMETKKPYIDYDFDIKDLAKLVNTTMHKLSRVINESFNKSFYEFVNKYRIKEIESKLKDPINNNLTVISLAYDCGFSSKSAFYSAFKHFTGTTPTEYRKNLQKNHQQVYLN